MKLRKLISSVLIATLAVGSISTFSTAKVFASENVINVTKNNNGQFIDSTSSKNSLKARLVQGEVYSLDNGTLLLQTAENSYEVVQRKTAKLNNIKSILNDPSIPQEVKADVIKKSQQAAETNSTSATVDVYTPVNSVTSGGISPMTTTDSYYTYFVNGKSHKMKDTVAYYTNFNSGHLQYTTGINAGNVANSIKEFVIMGASEANPYVAIFTTGISVLQNFLNAFGAKTYYGSADDFSEFQAFYDITTKWTFYDRYGDGGWATGAVTEKVYLRYIRMEEYFTTEKGGNTSIRIVNYNKTFTTPNFNYPAPIAVQWAGGPGWVENNLSIRYGGTLFVY